MMRLLPAALARRLVLAALAGCAFADAGAQVLTAAHCTSVADHQRVAPEQGGLIATPSSLPPNLAANALWLSPRALLWAGFTASAGGKIVLQGDGAPLAELGILRAPPPGAAAARYMGTGAWLSVPVQTPGRLRDWMKADLRLVHLDAAGQVLAHTRIQAAPLIDQLFVGAERQPLGARVGTDTQGTPTRLAVWAPTARAVGVCLEAPGASTTAAPTFHRLQADAASGVWSVRLAGDLDGWRYRFLLAVHVPGQGLVRQLVTDPYSATLTADSARSVIADLDRDTYRPPGWQQHKRPHALQRPGDLSVYELHVRDFSWSDASVPAADRGKYRAFTHTASAGMRHLAALARAGLSDVHLLPVFDFSTVPERGCDAQVRGAEVHAGSPSLPPAPDSPAPAEGVAAAADRDCFNWGYDPWHFNAPEGSFASDPDDPAARVRELRAAIAALHGVGLRVGMDLVFNHTAAAGQARASVLDRIVPGYYHRRNASGAIERSTCCENTATEHRMMERLMRDSMAWWARHYAIDSFRLDLMGHIPSAAVLRAQQDAERAAGRRIDVIGEGWDFGEVAGGARFVQATQGPMAGTPVATFNDRLRDAVRGPRPTGTWQELQAGAGWLHSGQRGLTREAQSQLADEVRAGLAGSVGTYVMELHDGSRRTLASLRYGDASWGYARHPSEGVNYVENHDDLGLFDLNALRLPEATPPLERAQLQLVGIAIGLLAQGRAYLHAGVDLMRSKSGDRNSYDSGDWFNRIDWSGQHNGFGLGLPPARENAAWLPLVGERLRAADRIRPEPAHIALVRQGVLDLLRIRNGSPLFRLETAQQARRQLHLPLAAPTPDPAVVALWLKPQGAGSEVLALFSVADEARRIHLPALGSGAWRLHPVLAAADAADPRIAMQARAEGDGRSFALPARSVSVWLRNRP